MAVSVARCALRGGIRIVTIVVTGASGHIGSNRVRRLLGVALAVLAGCSSSAVLGPKDECRKPGRCECLVASD